MNPRTWLYYYFDQNACLGHQTAEACSWIPTNIYVQEGDDTMAADGYMLERAGGGNVLRLLFNPHTGAVDAWEQPTVHRYLQDRGAFTRWVKPRWGDITA